MLFQKFSVTGDAPVFDQIISRNREIGRAHV
jgi:hypothetical protein